MHTTMLYMIIQWNPSIAATLGEQYLAVTEEWPLLRGFFYFFIFTQNVHLGPGFLAVIHVSQLAFIQGWPLRGVPCTVAWLMVKKLALIKS